MGHSHGKDIKQKPKSSRLSSETITSLLTTGAPRICSHQQVDDHRKRETHTIEHTTIEG